MQQNSSFNLAVKYIHQKQYEKAELILQNLLKNFPFDERIVLYYGYSLIEQHKYEEALAIYRQYLQINSEQYRLLRAFCYAKMGFLDKALNDWLKLSNEGNKIAISLLTDLKKAKDNKAFLTFLKYNKACGSLPSISGKLKKDINKSKRFSIKANSFSDRNNSFSVNLSEYFKRNQKKIILLFISTILILSVFFIILNITKNNADIKPKKNSIESNLQKSNQKTNIPVSIIFFYQDKKQIEKDLNLAKKYISQTDYNNSRLILNKIIYSNADEKYKEKARNLVHLLTEPFFNKLTLNPTYNEIIQNPLLYKDIFIQWKGLVYELIDDYNFSLMVYSKNPIYIDGISQCVLPKPYPLFVKQQIEIFGKIIDLIDNKIPKIEIKNIRVIYE